MIKFFVLLQFFVFIISLFIWPIVIYPKDVPFMSIWVVCTYISFNFFDKIIDKGNVDYLNTLALSLMTAYLLSIRVAGILIFIQYLITFLFF